MSAQQIFTQHWTDSNGVPIGGHTYSTGVIINWQKGPLVTNGARYEPNGAFVETVIAIAKDRLEYYQSTRFACDENTAAIACLAEALGHMDRRTKRRTEAGVEGTNKCDLKAERGQ